MLVVGRLACVIRGLDVDNFTKDGIKEEKGHGELLTETVTFNNESLTGMVPVTYFFLKGCQGKIFRMFPHQSLYYRELTLLPPTPAVKACVTISYILSNMCRCIIPSTMIRLVT